MAMRKDRDAKDDFERQKIRLYDLRIKNNAKDHDAHYLKILVLMKLNEKDQAILCLNEAIKINSNIPSFYALKAQIHIEQKDYKQAKKEIEKINISKLSDNLQDQMTKNIVLDVQNKIQKLTKTTDKNFYNSKQKEQQELKNRIEVLEKKNDQLEFKIDELQSIVNNLITDSASSSNNQQIIGNINEDN